MGFLIGRDETEESVLNIDVRFLFLNSHTCNPVFLGNLS